MRVRPRLALACATAAALLSGTPLLARADASPVDVTLGQVSGLTSASLGQRATGLAEVVLAEGEARVSATGLASLDTSHRYVAWLVNQQTGESYELGVLASVEGLTGAARLDAVMPDAIPDDGWTTVLVTVENGARADAPSSQHVIAGSFSAVATDLMPSALPNTGGDPDTVPAEDDRLPQAGLAALIAVATGALGFGIGRATSTRLRP